MDTKTTVWSVFVALSFVYCTIQAISLAIFWRMRSFESIKKRFPRLLLTDWSISMLIGSIGIPALAYHLFGLTNNGFDIKSSLFLMVVLSYASVFVRIARIWLLTFELHRLNFSDHGRWIEEIDAEYENLNWYLRHKKTLGNEKYVAKIFVVAYIIWIIMSIGMLLIALKHDVYHKAAISNVSVCYVVTLGFAIFTFVQCREYSVLDDRCLFFYEVKAIFFIWLSLLIVWIVLTAATANMSHPAYTAARLGVAHASNVALTLLSTAVIPYKVLWLQSDELMRHSLKHIENNCVDPHKMLRFALSDKALFSNLIQNLYKEFSSEVALSFIEFLQFKQRMVDDLSMNGSKTNDGSSNGTKQQEKSQYSTLYLELLNAHLPKSRIVHKKRPGLTLNYQHRAVARELYQKYLTVGCAYEVNIGYEERGAFERINASNWDLNNDEFVEVFDGLLRTLIGFIGQSYTRYCDRL